MKRLFDLLVCFAMLPIVVFPLLLTWILVKLTSHGPAIYWSDRVGRENQIFQMPKFRTMRTDTPQLATHLLADSERWITPFGRFLRKTSLDELPQIWSILRGEMSLVGPRPALFNQTDLVSLRTEKGIHKLRPGLTGWAQVNGRDTLQVPEKVAFDEFYLHHQSIAFDLKIMAMTISTVARGDDILQSRQQ
ncbi:MAG: sugar transferase [Planctomycetaceae bacterium]|nr:sugar transferase [Planctomycetaceae bacterium]